MVAYYNIAGRKIGSHVVRLHPGERDVWSGGRKNIQHPYIPFCGHIKAQLPGNIDKYR